MATLNDLLNSVTDTVSQGFDVFVAQKVAAEVAPPTAQQVPHAVPIPVKSTLQQVMDYQPVLWVAAGLLALYLVKK